MPLTLRAATTLPCSRLHALVALALLALAAPVAAEPGSATALQPRRLNDWRLRCAADRDEIEGALGPAQSSRSFADLDSTSGACRVLAGSGGPCAQARAELLTTLLNVGAGRVSATACVLAGEERKPLATLVTSADGWLFNGCTSAQCDRIVSGLRGVNDGSRLASCGPEIPAMAPSTPTPSPEVSPATPEPQQAVAAPPVAPQPIASQPIVAEVLPREAPTEWSAPPLPLPVPSAAALPLGTCCDPRSATAWQRACGLSGKWTTLTRSLDGENQVDFGLTTCSALASPDIDAREESKRQLIALRLNVRSGYLAPNCGLLGGETVQDAAWRAFRARREGRFEEARDIALAVNESRTLAARMPCSKPPEGVDISWEPAPPPPARAVAEPTEFAPANSETRPRRKPRH